MKKSFLVIIILFQFACINLFGIELSLKMTPTVLFPFLTTGEEKWAIASGGAVFNPGVNLFDFLNVSPELGFFVVPKKNREQLKEDESKTVLLVPIGVHVGGFFYPFSRIELGVGLSAGAYIASFDDMNHYAPWYRAYGEANFRATPDLSFGLNASWFDAQYDTYVGNPLLQGLSGGISVKYRFDTQKTVGNVSANVFMEESVFPLFYTIYRDNHFGKIIVQNNETAEIRNVNVYFKSEGYTNSQIKCGEIKILRKHKEYELPLIADFSEQILQFTENGKIPAEIVIEYEMLGQKRTSVSQVIIPVYNRNQVRWTDPEVIASYISTSAQEILEFSKYLVGVARTYLRSGLNRNMQFAMYVFEGIRLFGIKCEPDKSTPYDSFHLDSNSLDYIQYPYQTMLYKSGDKDDIGILLMALMESVGIQSSYITLKDDFIVLFNTGVNITKASSFFDGYDRVMVIDNEVWIPLSMKVLNEGFINSWYNAVFELQAVTENNEDYGFVNLEKAWQYYPPAGFSSGEHIEVSTSETELSNAVETDIARYITAEFGPQIAAIQNRIRLEGASVELYNKLGMLYVRAGMYSSAIPVYKQSAKMGSIAAMNNLGNIASLQKKYSEAQLWYSKVLEIDPANKTALKNLNRIQSELEK